MQVIPAKTRTVSVVTTGCPGPNLNFTANVLNNGNHSNIIWFRNGIPIWSGPTCTMFSAANGDEIYCEATPFSLAICTQPPVAASASHTVSCITVGVQEITGLESVLLSPNPNAGWFNLQVELSAPNDGHSRIFNTTGQELLTEKVSLADGSLDLQLRMAAPVSGMYWLILQAEGGSYRATLPVQNAGK